MKKLEKQHKNRKQQNLRKKSHKVSSADLATYLLGQAKINAFLNRFKV